MANQVDRRHIAERTAKILIDIEAVGARPQEPFTLTSGTKSPVYIDCRRLISFVPEREEVIGFLEQVVGIPQGPSTQLPGARPQESHAAFLELENEASHALRAEKPKGFGKTPMVEGDLADGAHVVLVEDLIFDGGSKVNFING